MKFQRLPLDPSVLRAVCVYASKHAILPEDVIRVAVGLRARELFLIDVSRVSQSFAHGARYLDILGELYRGNSAKFEEVAPGVRGRVRTYFARTRGEIESTGSSNEAAPIPGSPWFTALHNSSARRSQTVRTLMTDMGGFTSPYIRMISHFSVSSVKLPWEYLRALSIPTVG